MAFCVSHWYPVSHLWGWKKGFEKGTTVRGKIVRELISRYIPEEVPDGPSLLRALKDEDVLDEFGTDLDQIVEAMEALGYKIEVTESMNQLTILVSRFPVKNGQVPEMAEVIWASYSGWQSAADV